MAFFLSVANRKGGVGKSTISAMIAHGLAVWGRRKVLVIDLDTQCNASLILMGSDAWDAARQRALTVADYFSDYFDGRRPEPSGYAFSGVTDIIGDAGKPPLISLLPGSLDLEDIEHEMLHRLASQSRSFYFAEGAVIGRIRTQLKRFGDPFDVVLLDCPPGLSFATKAALEIANRVLVPFRPDYVSRYAVDRISRMVEKRPRLEDVIEIPFERRRYVTIANLVQRGPKHRRLIENIADYHPLLATRIPQKPDIANAFDWREERLTLEEKYGDSLDVVRSLCSEVSGLIDLPACNEEASI